ncbi:hypothetical protein DINM_021381 [Dirofilaria immitis]|nr:hypothetical protein [Dirofilaria immitis]
MTSDRDGLLKNASSGTISIAGPSEIVISESLDDTTPSETNEFGDCGTFEKTLQEEPLRDIIAVITLCFPNNLFSEKADPTEKSVPDDGLQIANYDENTVVNQGTSEWPLPQLTFHHVHGSNIQILRGGRVARRRESFCKGLAFSSRINNNRTKKFYRPIQIDENVCIRFAEVVSNWSGVLRFGVTNVDPETFRGIELPKFACPDLTSKEGYWAKALPERYSVAGSILHFYVNAEGELYYGINGVLKGQFLNGINVFSPLWVIVDIYGNSSSLEFIDPNEVRFRSTRSTVSRNRASSRPVSTTSISQAQIATTSAIAHHRHSRNSIQFTPLTFHTVRGKHVALTHAYTVAERHAGEYACGYVFTSRPLALNEKIVVQVLDVESAYTGSMAFGLTCCDPVNLQERPEYWVGIKDVAAQPKINDELSFWITEKGEVYFAKNNLAPRVIIHVDISVRLKCESNNSVSLGCAAFPPIPTNTRTSRSLLDLSPETRIDIGGPNNELSAFPTTSTHSSHDSRENCSPLYPEERKTERRVLTSTPPVARPSRPIFISGEHFIDFLGNLDNIHGLDGSESNISHRPQFPPPPVPARSSPVGLLPERASLHPLPRFPLSAQTASQQQRSGDDEGEIGDECRICMNSKVNCVIYTCGHMSMCFECATETWHLNGECPICRKKIEDVIKIYKPGAQHHEGQWHSSKVERSVHIGEVSSSVPYASKIHDQSRAKKHDKTTTTAAIEQIKGRNNKGTNVFCRAVRSYGFGLSSVDNSETDDNGGAFLLDIRFIRSIENLNREFCRASKLISLSDEGFHSSISQESSTKNHLFAIRAAVTGNISQLLYLIHVLKVSVNSANSQGITLLHWATENDHVAVVRLLGRSVLHTAAYSDAANCLKLFLKIFFEQEKMDIVKRNDCETSYKFIFQRDLNGNSPLHLACRLRSKHCLKILLSFIMKYFGWSIVEEMLQQCNKSNQTPVHVACLWNSIEATNLLLTDNLNKIVNKIYKSRKRNNVAVALREASRRSLFWQIGRGIVLHEMATVKCSYACFTKNSSFLEYDNEFEASELKMHLLDECTSVRCSECDKAQLGVVRVILKCCPELVLLRDALGQTALMCSVINDAISLTKALLVYRRVCGSGFPHSITSCSGEGKLRQAALLVKRGASVKRQDSYGATPMHYAAIHGFCATLRLLYQANKYTDEVRTNNGHSAFMWAAMSGINISIRTMIDANPVVSREDSDHQGCTALHLAAAGDHVEVINTLLLFKWNAEKRNKLGETPLVVATKVVVQKPYDALCMLLNNTVLHVAVNSDGKKEILRQLLHSLKDSSLLNMRNDMGQTPLHCATKYNAVQCVRYLLKYGADPLIKDNRGWDPLMVAIQQDCWSTIILLLKKKNYLLASFLETNGAMLASEIRDMAARMYGLLFLPNISFRGS